MNPEKTEKKLMDKALEYFIKNDIRKCDNMLRKAYLINPMNADIYSLMALTQYKFKDIETAIGLYQRAIFFKPNVAQYHYNLGVLFLELNNINDAIEQFNNTISLLPSHKNANLLMKKLKKKKCKRMIKKFYYMLVVVDIE